jgi:hyperosmotically inducible periplasmic protein
MLATGSLCAQGQAQAQGRPSASASASASASVASPVSAKAMRAANRQLAKDVRKALARNKTLSLVNVTVRAKQGVVTLQGSMPDTGQIQQAAQIAGSVPGVASVKNDLTTIRQAQ